MSYNYRFVEGQQAYCWNIDSPRRATDPVYAAGYANAKHEAHVIQSGKYIGPGCQRTLDFGGAS